ncbi:MAG: hypothetical protein HGB06_01440 [Chlorobaculum sp.]|nr:hypothetical protein [Chlorobaculum sp.]
MIAVLSIAFLLTYLKRHTTMIFIVYRLIIGVMISTGRLTF